MHSRKNLCTLVLGVSLLSLSSCAPSQTDLAGTSWVFEQCADESVATLGPTEITITFEEDGTVRGFYAYLNYAGNYSIEDDALTISDICWLSLICQAADPIVQPQAFVDTLMKAERYTADGDTLVIYAGDEELVFHANR